MYMTPQQDGALGLRAVLVRFKLLLSFRRKIFLSLPLLLLLWARRIQRGSLRGCVVAWSVDAWLRGCQRG